MSNEQNNLSPKEQYELKKKDREHQKHKEKIKEKMVETPKRVGKYIFYLLVVAAIVSGFVWFVTRLPNLPPTTAQGHTEDMPSAHISNTRIPDTMQRHLLEHADGNDANGQGVIIQYNCKDYDCEPDLIERLASLVEEYPKNVYLAPNNYDGKIILTKLSRREILDEFDEQTIRNFIE